MPLQLRCVILGEAMTDQELNKRKAYFAKVRLNNYQASLRLEGIEVPNIPPAQNKAEILEKYKATKS
ncbi:YhfG family protein [Spartinivicinus poritis]|uniref:YhfG family protein n=1 Tax=Spartinivicinus poritis TaxID=2994640 RepID=A0ABT5UIV4_9GAMM|nr:YhfG family protein [Spartinivicinus sp. A2-2]MDE1465916.1 YhfG family protein [Spartinivicinus sp. A2-2]